MDAQYIGDGLYAEFDGYHIVIKANDLHRPTDTVYLDFSTAEALRDYINKTFFEDIEEA